MLIICSIVWLNKDIEKEIVQQVKEENRNVNVEVDNQKDARIRVEFSGDAWDGDYGNVKLDEDRTWIYLRGNYRGVEKELTIVPSMMDSLESGTYSLMEIVSNEHVTGKLRVTQNTTYVWVLLLMVILETQVFKVIRYLYPRLYLQTKVYNKKVDELDTKEYYTAWSRLMELERYKPHWIIVLGLYMIYLIYKVPSIDVFIMNLITILLGAVGLILMVGIITFLDVRQAVIKADKEYNKESEEG